MSETKEVMPYKDYPQHPENPFKSTLVSHMTDNRKGRTTKVMASDMELVDKESGLAIDKEAESLFVATIKSVDNEQFTKVYQGAIQLMTEVSGKSINVFMWYIFPKLKQDSLQIIFNMDECVEATTLSKPTIYAALSELIEADLIAKSELNWLFYINPKYIFNGDRIRLVNEFVREGSEADRIRRNIEEQYKIGDHED